jgi:Family of unknown function (DUF6662)
VKRTIAVIAAALLCSSIARGDEQLFGFVRGAETLPKNRFEIYQFATLRTGKDQGTYNGADFESEIEYGVTDQLQMSASVINHYFYNQNVPDLPDKNNYRFGGLEFSAKYRVLSPFKNPIGLALRLESGYLLNDEVDGLPQHERHLKPEIDLQKDFFDDTLIINFDVGAEWAWGKQPAEQYPREFSLESAGGVAYRFAPNWFAGAEGNFRAEYPLFDLYQFEHRVFYAGPSLHYARERWWATLTYNYQVFGKGIDEPANSKTFAEEQRHVFRLKVGFNF